MKIKLIFFLIPLLTLSCKNSQLDSNLKTIAKRKEAGKRFRSISSLNDQLVCNYEYKASDIRLLNKEIFPDKDTNFTFESGDGLRLDLNSGQEHLFKKVKPYFHLESLSDVKDCSDVSCLYRNLYRSSGDNERTAEIITWWNSRYSGVIDYRYYFSTENVGLENKLFKKEEIEGFWNYAFHIPSTFIDYLTFTTIRRFPSEFVRDDKSTILKGSVGVCGVAHSSGYIALSDTCMVQLDFFKAHSESEDYVYDSSSSMYNNFTHELGHLYDFKYDRNNGERLAYTKDWLTLSGWNKNPVAEEENEEDYREWLPSTKNNFLRDYAKVSPGEDFAESITGYVMSPIAFKKISLKKYNFLKI